MEKKLLIVDDEVHIRMLIEQTLEELEDEGVSFLSAENGEQALEIIQSENPQLVFLDVMMPKVSGFDVLDIIRNTPETANLKVVMLTALSQEADRKRAEDLGVDDYLVKSQVVITDVIDRLKHHMGL